MTIKECLENGVMDLEDEVDYNDTPEGEEIACLRLEIERLNTEKEQLNSLVNSCQEKNKGVENRWICG